MAVFSFDVNEFKSKYCSEEIDSYEGLWCENFKLSSADKDYIQNNDFVISEKSFLRISKADIGVLNTNFFRKFPNAETINILLSKVVFASSEDQNERHPLKILTFKSCKIYGSDNSNALKSLRHLEEFSIVNPKHFEKVKMDSKFFENNVNLRSLEIILGPLVSLEIDLFGDGVLDLFPNLEFFSYDGIIPKITKEVFANNPNLTYLRLQDNDLVEISGETPFPDHLKALTLSRNHLRNISIEYFKNLKDLKILDLSINNIGNFDACTFDDLENLRLLYLDANEIRCFSEQHIRNLKHLKALYLRYNYLDERDLGFINKEKIKLEIYPQRHEYLSGGFA